MPDTQSKPSNDTIKPADKNETPKPKIESTKPAQSTQEFPDFHEHPIYSR